MTLSTVALGLKHLVRKTRIDSGQLASVVVGAAAGLFEEPASMKRLGRFELLRILGEGATSAVYEAVDGTSGERVALKVPKQSVAYAAEALAREHEVGSLFSHPNIVRYGELVQCDGALCCTMEAVYGSNLLDFVWHKKRVKRAQPTGVDVTRLRSVLAQLCAALLTLHGSRTAHCDVKPSNVLVTEQGRVVLVDFGLASSFLLGDHVAAHRNAVLGTPAYMPPEQFGVPRFTPACDWYAVGGTIFHAFVGRPPFGEEGSIRQTRQRKLSSPPPAPSDFVSGVPADLNGLCCDLLRANSYERPSGREVLKRLGGRAALFGDG